MPLALSANLLKHRRLFVNPNLEATLDERKRRRQPACAAAGYDDHANASDPPVVRRS